ncbi:hypothetical protein [Treponema sp. JC4]|uniref:hypothetical protein n=1 Tax=Treponema sp. JC4 TaxID=1124982 RepID=UPI0002F43FD7|nr:hypothetical protein [Treponema sp. JC4]
MEESYQNGKNYGLCYRANEKTVSMPKSVFLRENLPRGKKSFLPEKSIFQSGAPDERDIPGHQKSNRE